MAFYLKWCYLTYNRAVAFSFKLHMCSSALLDQRTGWFSWSSSDLRGAMWWCNLILLFSLTMFAVLWGPCLDVLCVISIHFALWGPWTNSTVQITFYKCWIVAFFQVKFFEQTERINGFPVSSKFRSVATQAMSLCGFFPFLQKIKSCLETRLTFCDL